jgi:hypothetical protein
MRSYQILAEGANNVPLSFNNYAVVKQLRRVTSVDPFTGPPIIQPIEYRTIGSSSAEYPGSTAALLHYRLYRKNERG